MRQLLAALGDDIKPKGKDWIAKCPVHGDKDFAMGIMQLSDSSLVVNCLACGANGLDLYKHLGLDLDELFGGKKLEKDKPFIPSHIAGQLLIDKACVIYHEHDLEQEKQVTYKDKKRYRLAIARIKGVKEKYIM
jgi:hypothetical protein